MDRSYEDAYSIAEERHPWFTARRALFSALAGEDRSARILDVGCGTGIFLAHLKALRFENLAGVEPSKHLRAGFRDETIELFDELPEGRYDKIFMLDVLEHIEDDGGTLARIHRTLEPGGFLFLSVPAHPFLWSRHDEVNQHYRRYRKRQLTDLLLGRRFEIRKLSYWNMTLFPAISLTRLIRRHADEGELGVGGSRALALYGRILLAENWLLRRFSLPMGVSLIAVAQRRTDPAVPA